MYFRSNNVLLVYLEVWGLTLHDERIQRCPIECAQHSRVSRCIGGPAALTWKSETLRGTARIINANARGRFRNPFLMPIRVTAAKISLGGVLHCQDQHVWITDKALQTAFDRFVSPWNAILKRHGSHAPGPLEAARREGRRRRYGLATGRDVSPAAAVAAIAQDVSAMAGTWGSFGGFNLWGLPQPKWQPPRNAQDTENTHLGAHGTGMFSLRVEEIFRPADGFRFDLVSLVAAASSTYRNEFIREQYPRRNLVRL